MGGDAHLVDDGGHQLLQARGVQGGLPVLHQLCQVLHHGLLVVGLADEHGRAQFPGVRHHLLVDQVGDGQNLGAVLPVQAAQDAHPVQAGQDHVQHQQVRLGLLHQTQGLRAVPGGAGDLKPPGALQGLLQHGTGLFVGICQHDSNFLIHSIYPLLI